MWIIKAFGIHEIEANESNYTTIIKFYARKVFFSNALLVIFNLLHYLILFLVKQPLLSNETAPDQEGNQCNVIFYAESG